MKHWVICIENGTNEKGDSYCNINEHGPYFDHAHQYAKARNLVDKTPKGTTRFVFGLTSYLDLQVDPYLLGTMELMTTRFVENTTDGEKND